MSQHKLLFISTTDGSRPAVVNKLDEMPDFTIEQVADLVALPAKETPSSVDCVLVSNGLDVPGLKETIGIARNRWAEIPVILVIGDGRLQAASEEQLSLVDDCLYDGGTTVNQSVLKHQLLSTIEMANAQAQLHRHRDLLRRTQELANIGVWEYDLKKEKLRWTEKVYEIHDLPLEYEPVVDEALGFYHTKDLPEIESKLETLLKTGEAFSLRVRIVTATGTVKWVRVCGDSEVSDDVIDGQLELYRELCDSSHLDTV